ncbi:MAG: hypothetical protein A2Y17_08420 [Clostridiales bacterium GWF2_38_85]|nr:MAG: hypothetical protein A2Y17_08420 [Clostridiales bacterium GWF2_38_85]HBL83783.1 hypothetical protein [Clostridiales bacterium]
MNGKRSGNDQIPQKKPVVKQPPQKSAIPQHKRSPQSTKNEPVKYKVRPENRNKRQTPASQTAHSVRKQITPRQKRIIEERKRRKREFFTVKLIIFLTFYVLISLAFSGFIVLSLKNSTKTEQVDYLEVIVDEENTIKLNADVIYKDNILYIPYEKLDNLCNFVLTGDNNKITLIMSSGIDYVAFYRNSDLIYIGGSSYRLTSPVLFESDDYYIPLEFIDNYMKGIVVEFDEKKDKYTVMLTQEPLTFVGKFPSTSERVNESTIPSVNETSEET